MLFRRPRHVNKQLKNKLEYNQVIRMCFRLTWNYLSSLIGAFFFLPFVSAAPVGQAAGLQSETCGEER